MPETTEKHVATYVWLRESQVHALRHLAVDLTKPGKRVSVSDLVREVLDTYLKSMGRG